MFCFFQHPGISLYFHLHSLSLARYILVQQILPLSRFYNKKYNKFQTMYKKLCNKMSNICSSTQTVQSLHVFLSARKRKTVYLLLTNLKADIHNHISVIITHNILFLDFYGDRLHSWILSDTPNTTYIFQLYIYIWTDRFKFTLHFNRLNTYQNYYRT